MAEKPGKTVESTTESRYPVEELTAHAEALFNVRPEVLSGALYGTGQLGMTIDEAKKAIDLFMKRKVR